MAQLLVRRSLTALVQLAALVIAVFFLIRLLPADPVARFVGFNASPEAYAAAARRLGVDRPAGEQFLRFLGVDDDAQTRGLLQGSLGTSWVSGEPVLREIATYLPITLELVSLSFLVAIAIGVPVGRWGARRPDGLAAKATLSYGLFAGSQPEFCWGLLFIYVFFESLGIAPGPVGRLSPLSDPPAAITGFLTIDTLLRGDLRLFAEALHYLMLPVATLAFVLSGPIIKTVRDGTARVLRSDFVLYARALGLPENLIARKALRAAIAPSITLIGVLYAFMLGGAVLVESVFAFSGLGQYAIRSILAFDYPAIQGVVLAISAVSLVVYLLVDILQIALDPRIAR